MSPSKPLRGLPDEEHLAALVEHRSGQPDGIADTGHGAHRARLERVAGHEGRVHLDDPLDGQHGAEARVEQRVVLEHGDRGDHGVERVSSRVEHGPPRLDGARHAVPARGTVGRRFGSRAPVHGDHRHGASTRAGIARL